jgi:hypothetical protein
MMSHLVHGIVESSEGFEGFLKDFKGFLEDRMKYSTKLCQSITAVSENVECGNIMWK